MLKNVAQRFATRDASSPECSTGGLCNQRRPYGRTDLMLDKLPYAETAFSKWSQHSGKLSLLLHTAAARATLLCRLVCTL